MAEDLFVPTEKYLTLPYANCEYMLRVCRALDRLYFKPMYDDLVRKNAVYDLGRYDLATEDTFDDVREHAYSLTRGVPFPWPEKDTGLALKYPPDIWAKKRIYLHTVLDQFLSLPYTYENLQMFVKEVEKELHYYESEIPWVKVEFEEDNPNVLCVYRNYAFPKYESMCNVIKSLCRRISPCNIYVAESVF